LTLKKYLEALASNLGYLPLEKRTLLLFSFCSFLKIKKILKDNRLPVRILLPPRKPQ